MAATTKSTDLWEGGIIAYVIDGGLSRVDLVNEAIEYYEQNTNLRFVKRHYHKDYIVFRPDARSPFYSDAIGREGGEQTVNVSANTLGVYLHEIGHAIGLIHEMKRHDRDQFVTLHLETVDDKSQYAKESDSVQSTIYDYVGIMHYSGINNGTTIIESKTGVPNPGGIGRGDEPTDTDLQFINRLYPAKGVIRRGSSEQGAGGISEVAIAGWQLPPNAARIITAVRNASQKLQLIPWTIGDNGSGGSSSNTGNIVRGGDPPLDHGKATNISLLSVGNYIVGCMKNAAGNLYLISWNHMLVKQADSGVLAGSATNICVILLSPDAFMTACVAGSGKLLIIIWRINAAGVFTRVSDSGTNGPSLSDISIAIVTETQTRKIVAITGKSGNIKIFTYQIDIPGLRITSLTNSANQMGNAYFARSVKSETGHLIIGCAAEDSQELLLIPFTISSDGRTITRLTGKEAKAGKIKELQIIARPYGILTGVCSNRNNLLLIKWRVSTNGQITRLGDSGDEAGALINAIDTKPVLQLFSMVVPNAPVCTAVKNASGDLLLISWDDMNGPGEIIR